ncbi:MAG TPA: diguanylate cyclase [Burkholderiaceae bacterium]|jgi:diguanylate cyclase (GGDEF)-like protein
MGKHKHRFLEILTSHTRIFVFVSILIILLAVGASYEKGKHVALERIELVLDGRINAHKHFLVETIGKFSLVPEIVATSDYARELVLAPSKENVETTNRYLEHLTAKIGVDRIYIIDVNGTTLAANLGKEQKSIIGQNYKFRPYFKEALDGNTGHFIAVGIASPILGYYIARPIFVNGKIRGVVAMRISISLDAFRGAVNKYWQNDEEIALITDSKGIVFMSPFEKWMFNTVTPLTLEEKKDIQKTHQYDGKDLTPIPIIIESALSNEMQLVKFKDLPSRSFVEKSYEVGDIKGRTYLYVDAAQYWEPIIFYAGAAATLGTAVLLLGMILVQRFAYQTKLVEAAIRDPLTGLFTRLYMTEWLTSAKSNLERNPNSHLALVIFDLDHFKKVNDTYGHLTGDAVLKGVAEIILSSIRAEDLAVRFGGEEIAIFVHFIEEKDICVLANRIRQKLDEKGIDTEKGKLSVTMSGGVAIFSENDTPKDVFDRADKKLYEAKEQGRNRILM